VVPSEGRQDRCRLLENLDAFHLVGPPRWQGECKHTGRRIAFPEITLGPEGTVLKGFGPILDANAIFREGIQRTVIIDVERCWEVVRVAQRPPIFELRPEAGLEDQALGPDAVSLAKFHDVHVDLLSVGVMGIAPSPLHEGSWF
jgi:hypothetical protein